MIIRTSSNIRKTSFDEIYHMSQMYVIFNTCRPRPIDILYMYCIKMDLKRARADRTGAGVVTM